MDRSLTSIIGIMLRELGLKHESRCYQNHLFMLALLAGVLFLWLFHDLMPPFSSSHTISWLVFLSLVVWQPFIEELLFRGFVQGQIARHERGRRAWRGISLANVITSVLFAAMHMVNSSPLFALTVFVPSLVFGYFRDYCNSIYPCILLHGAYNAMVIVGLMLNGNMTLPSL